MLPKYWEQFGPSSNKNASTESLAAWYVVTLLTRCTTDIYSFFSQLQFQPATSLISMGDRNTTQSYLASVCSIKNQSSPIMFTRWRDGKLRFPHAAAVVAPAGMGPSARNHWRRLESQQFNASPDTLKLLNGYSTQILLGVKNKIWLDLPKPLIIYSTMLIFKFLWHQFWNSEGGDKKSKCEIGIAQWMIMSRARHFM